MAMSCNIPVIINAQIFTGKYTTRKTYTNYQTTLDQSGNLSLLNSHK